jgi:molybdate transport system permease protein
MSALIVALCLLLFAAPVCAFAAEGGTVPVEVSRSGTEARMDGVAFGVAGLERLNKGTDKEYKGTYFGYRYPMASAESFVVVVIDERTALVYLPQQASSMLAGSSERADFEMMLEALDERVSRGGTMLKDMGLSYEYTSEHPITRGAYLYDFAVEVEPGYYYATVTGEGGADSSAGALFCVSGTVADAASVPIEAEPTGFAAVAEFFTSLDLRPFWVSLRTSAVAMVFVFVLGLLAAWFSLRINSRVKGILDSVFTIPLVLPPTVCGFLLLVLFGNSTPVGRWLLAHGIELIFSWPAAVLAAVVVSFPLMYRTARGAFEGLDPALGDAARTLGWGEWRIFYKLTMPLAWPSIAAGTVLAFARAMGEFGATLFVAGNYPGVTQTMPIAIYFEWMGGHSDVATFWVFVVILFSFVVILFVNWYASHTQRYRRASSDETDDAEKTGDASAGFNSTDGTDGTGVDGDRGAAAQSRVGTCLLVDIRKAFPNFELNVCLEGGNETLGLLGASGCGKSLTLRCIAGLEKPDEGRIVVAGTTFFDSDQGVNLTPQQRKTALLFQSYMLFPNLTVAQNIAAGIPRGTPKAQAQAIVAEQLARFGLEGFGGRYPVRLSGGQQQRVALARMLAAKPAVLMLDEPFSALDSHLKSALEQDLLDLFDSFEGTVVYVSHDIDEAFRFCDRIAVIDRGGLAELADTADILNHPTSYATLRVSGVKNISAARRTGTRAVEALDWGVTLVTDEDVSDDIGFLGVRASFIRMADGQEQNGLDCVVRRVIDSRFERTVLLQLPGDVPQLLQWRFNKVDFDPGVELDRGVRVRVDIPPSRIHLVKD